jgi:hypothetical protein
MSTRAALTALLVALAAPSAAWAAALPPPTVVISPAAVIEGDAGLSPFTAQVSYTLYGGFPGPSSVEVDIVAQPGTASASDFVFTPVHLTLTANGPAQQITGSIVGDKVFEGNETFTLVAKANVDAGFFSSQPGLVTITDDDQSGAPRIDIDAVTTVPEGDGKHTVLVPVKLQPAIMREVTVSFGTTGGDFDYFQGTMGFLKFAPGQTTATIPVDVLGNTYWNSDRSFVITLADADGAVIGNAAGKVVLKNDDAPSVLSMSDLRVVEGTGDVTKVDLKVHISPPAPPFSKIGLTISGGSARIGEDYRSEPFQLIYPQGGETEMTFSFFINADAMHECDEGVVFQYQGVYMGDDTARTAKLLIADDDFGIGEVAACPDPYTGPPPAMDTTGMAGAPGDKGGAGTGGNVTGAAGTPPVTPEHDPGASSDRVGSRGGGSVAPAGAPGSGLEALVWIGIALAAVALRRAVRARLY